MDHDGLERLYLETITGKRRGFGASLLRGVLATAEMPYAGAMRARNALFDAGIKQTIDLRRPTISVGNLTAGGTGKTPVVRWLAERFLADKLKPAVLTRGYTKEGNATSDEAFLLERAIGPIGIVTVNSSRATGAEQTLAEHPDVSVFILDDGFQHRSARRDVDLVLVNAADPFGHGHVHPRGLLREPISGISRASAILLTHATRGSASIDLTIHTLRQHNPTAPIFRCDHVLSGLRTTHRALNDPPDAPLSLLQGKKFYATAGIGHPQSLETSLAPYGDNFVGHSWWDDHHTFSDADLNTLIHTATAHGATAIITTEKDWSKLILNQTVLESPIPFYRLDVGLRFHNGDEAQLYDLITQTIRAY